MSNEQFISDDYQAPASGGGYTKIEMGENRFRVLSNPLLLWVIWANGKSKRIPYNAEQKPALPDGENPSVKHAWAMSVWNYKTEQIEIFELDKATLREPLLAHARSADWGHPKGYDVIINKSGSGKDTKYQFQAVPHKPIAQNILDAMTETPIDLSQLLVEGGNPFIGTSTEATPQAPAQNAAPQQTPPPAGEQKTWIPF